MAMFEIQMYQNNVQLFGDDILVDQAMNQQKFTQVVLQRDSSAGHNHIKTLSIALLYTRFYKQSAREFKTRNHLLHCSWYLLFLCLLVAASP